MKKINLSELNKKNNKKKIILLSKINKYLNNITSEERIIWALKNLKKNFILSSSFGIQSSVCLHMITKIKPNIIIILIDTGYLFSETYLFIEELKKKLNLNLKIFRSKYSAAWQEARYGKLWKNGINGINKYNLINKIKPMNKAIKKFKVKTWFAGLRYEQSKSREKLNILSIHNKIFKFLPIFDWNNRKIFKYIKKNNLKYHPLKEKGYLSIGDTHTTTKWIVGMKEEDTRFFGLKRECGIHE
ncbi:phosphoadenosine phosphosulfate reductase [Enterobacterales bacterium endosymbiont of Anomoneura mori]|uniref:phosphoadenylyl-sulfate reductase n=1 Tax=Enterobacterales bacterium endosymbiont of Anomoneura mori TaxID=3132096 RepID=UPI00399D407F